MAKKGECGITNTFHLMVDALYTLGKVLLSAKLRKLEVGFTKI